MLYLIQHPYLAINWTQKMRFRIKSGMTEEGKYSEKVITPQQTHRSDSA